MRWPMGPVRLRHAASALVLAAVIGLGLGAPSAGSQIATSTATPCRGLTLSAAFRTVKPGGRVLLSGQACGAAATSSGSRTVSIALSENHRWRRAALARLNVSGGFSACVHVPRKLRSAKLRAVGPRGKSGSIRLAVRRTGGSGCDLSSSCPLSQPGSTIGMTLPSACTVVASDTAANSDPLPFWGSIDCQSASRQQQVASGGDAHVAALGGSQGNSAFRRMTVIDGDNFYGERCELGFNNVNGPTVFYREGQRRVTFISIRLPNGTDPTNENWRNVMQMKQAQPYNNPNTSPVFELQVHDGKWWVESSWVNLWSFPARQNAWTRFAFDVVYSQDPSVGSITTYADLTEDGDFDDANERSPLIHDATLRAETTPGYPSPYQPGDSIPSHLRAGIYQNANYSCPSGCSADIDNIQVVRP